jgi:hypothetical protein
MDFEEEGHNMLINSKKAEDAAILNLAYSVCAAVRTAPKAWVE